MVVSSGEPTEFPFWGSSNPEFVNVRLLHSQKVTVWAALCGSEVTGTISFTTTIKADAHEEMLIQSFLYRVYCIVFRV